MTTTALTTTTDRTPTITKLTARDVFNIWLADQSELTRTVYRAEIDQAGYRHVLRRGGEVATRMTM